MADPSEQGSARFIPRDALESLCVALLLALFVRTWFLQAFRIPSESMADNLAIGDHVLVNKFVYGPTRFAWEHALLPMRPPRSGDVAVFRFPLDLNRDFIKRCLGEPGDEVEIIDKSLRRNGVVLQEAGYVQHVDPNVYPNSPFAPERERDNFGPYRVPAENYFCLGDNRDKSNDSRFWGPVPRAHFKGRALAVYWSTQPVTDPAVPWWRRFGRSVRWSRCFHWVR